ncbi:MAG: hydantoinase B/oxoprolinase family protein [Candidatus Thorarchaeota archaeon]|nr:hydantoinase B/oxoprolinase family protein [Candidatus Thorarchaeota archaeon]
MIEDPILFEVIKNSLVSVSREMSLTLMRTAFSPNIKERRDCSCALFDSKGYLVAQSKDIPVHLGAMPMSVRSCISQIGDELEEGTMALLNDPYSGGSHLPDLTLVAPIFAEEECIAFAANRAHHSDVGGMSPGSMPGLATSIHEEGIVIQPRLVVRNGRLEKDTITDLLRETRTPEERLGDLSAQVAANLVGTRRLVDAAKEHSWTAILRTFHELQSYSAELMKANVSPYEGANSTFVDIMESDGAGFWDIPIKVGIQFTKKAVRIDFEGTAEQVMGNINCPLASTLSSVYYVFISLFGHEIPVNEGCWSVIETNVPEGTLLNPRSPAAVSAGNVETSQRIVDALLGALSSIMPDGVPAASQGTMNNLTIGGVNPRTGRVFSFYETIGGGGGAGKGAHGTSGIHVHMTNTLNTPIEALEIAYPLRVREYSIRKGSGGEGEWMGGDGIIREIEILSDSTSISVQSERRERSPWGLNGGGPGKKGQNIISYAGEKYLLQAKTTLLVPKDTIVRIETPGGGGWGAPKMKAPVQPNYSKKS